MRLAPVDYLILSLYFAFVLCIGWIVKRKVATSEDFLTSGRSVPVWITSLAFIAANLGAQEVIGMCASGAKYGIMTAHFYWIGAVPAMLFVGVFMMPFYYGSRARSVPEYLKLRFDEKTRALNAVTFAVMTVFSSGISMYALGLLFELVLHWSFTASVLLSAAIVLVYTFLGGLTSAIYNEVLQFFLIVLGFAPLVDFRGDEDRWLERHGGALARGDDAHLGVRGEGFRESDGRGSIRPGGGAGLRAVVRLLVHGFSGGAEGHGGRFNVGRASHAVDRGVSENGDAVYRDCSRHRGAGALAHGAGLFDSA